VTRAQAPRQREPESCRWHADAAQFAELAVRGELVDRCRARGVQAMVEGPGHIPFNQIQMNMEREQEVCKGAPFRVLGPVVTDIAPGYDHIVSAIGATAVAAYGASLLCYVTPAEHMGLPDGRGPRRRPLLDVRQGVLRRAHLASHSGVVGKRGTLTAYLTRLMDGSPVRYVRVREGGGKSIVCAGNPLHPPVECRAFVCAALCRGLSK